jgi:hypothetical protein
MTHAQHHAGNDPKRAYHTYRRHQSLLRQQRRAELLAARDSLDWLRWRTLSEQERSARLYDAYLLYRDYVSDPQSHGFQVPVRFVFADRRLGDGTMCRVKTGEQLVLTSAEIALELHRWALDKAAQAADVPLISVTQSIGNRAGAARFRGQPSLPGRPVTGGLPACAGAVRAPDGSLKHTITSTCAEALFAEGSWLRPGRGDTT